MATVTASRVTRAAQQPVAKGAARCSSDGGSSVSGCREHVGQLRSGGFGLGRRASPGPTSTCIRRMWGQGGPTAAIHGDPANTADGSVGSGGSGHRL
jgi:hypothetical protein